MAWAQKFSEWLVEEKEENFTTVDGRSIRVFSFNYDSGDNETMSAWAKHFRNHYCSDEIIDLLRSGTELSRKDYLLTLKFPDQTGTPGPSVRSGDFCEILIADYFEFLLNYWIPRIRYSNKSNKNSSPMGSDIIGLKIFDKNETQKDTIVVIEAKASLRSQRSSLQEAINHSTKDEKRLAESLNAMKHRYADMGNNENVQKIARFQNPTDKPYTMFYGAAALFSNGTYNEDSVKKSDASKHVDPHHLILLVIKGENMMSLVHELYRRAADEA